MKKKKKQVKKATKKPIRSKAASRDELVLLIVSLQTLAHRLQERLDIAEAQIENLLRQSATDKKYWSNWPYVNPCKPSWSPDWPTYYEVRTEVKRDAAV